MFDRAQPIDRHDLPVPAARLADIAATVAADAAALVRRERIAGFEIDTKSSSTDLVTRVDRASDSFIRARLAELRPSDGVVTEEADLIEGSSGITWICDPIDGTTNFVHGLSPYAVSIAATVDGQRPVAGAVVEIAHDDRFVAALGEGATLNGETIRCRSGLRLEHCVIGTGYGYDRDRRVRQAALGARIIGQIADLRRMGAAAVDLCNVAAGRLDAYYEHGLAIWDLAAGQIIAEEAGVRVEAIEGGPARPGSILAAPPDLIDELRSLLIEAGATDV